MTKKELLDVIKNLKSIYTLRTFMGEADSFDAWYAAFVNKDAEQVKAAVQKHIMNSSIPPTPADILNYMGNPDRQMPTWVKMNWWGIYSSNGELENTVYAPQHYSNQDIKKWVEERIGGDWIIRIIEKARMG